MITIRKAKTTDYESWLKHWNAYLEFYGANLDDAVTLSTWQRLLSSDSSLICWVAEHDKKIVGFALCVLHEGTWSNQLLCYLEDLFVETESRGLGIGKSLIETICKEAKEKSWSKVYWHTKHDNPARVLYDKLTHVDDFVRYAIKI